MEEDESRLSRERSKCLPVNAMARSKPEMMKACLIGRSKRKMRGWEATRERTKPAVAGPSGARVGEIREVVDIQILRGYPRHFSLTFGCILSPIEIELPAVAAKRA
jgi:hypothetical protein